MAPSPPSGRPGRRSHIVSDLEKLCDYIAFLHQGKLLLVEEKDRLLEEYGLLLCEEGDLNALPQGAVLGKRVSPYGVQALVKRSAVPAGLEIKTIGVEPAGAPRYSRSRAEGRPVQLERVDTIADGTRTDHADPNNFPVIEARVDQLCTVEDEVLRRAMVLLMTRARLTVEPSGALPVAAALAGRLPVGREDKVVFVLSGGNIDPALAAQLLTQS